MKEEIQKILEKMPFWKYLTKTQRDTFLQSSKIMKYAAGEAVYSGAKECLGTFFILEGTMRTYLLSEEGKEVTMYRLEKGDTCVLSASCILSAITFDVEIQAQTKCSALLIPAWALSGITKENVYLENFIYKEMAKRFSDVVGALEQLMFLSLTQRVASFLLDEGIKRKSEVLVMTHEEIARLIGSAREAVSRTLKQLAKKGYISLNRGEIKIEKREELYRLL